MRGKFLSLKFKVVLMVLWMAVFLTASALIVSYYIYSKVITEHYAKMTSNLAKTTAEILVEEDVRNLSQDILARYRDVCDGKMPPDLANVSKQEREAYFAAFAGPWIRRLTGGSMTAWKRFGEPIRCFLCILFI